MLKEKILVTGASCQIGVELTLALRKMHGNANVVASDLREENDLLKGTGPLCKSGCDEQGNAACAGDPPGDVKIHIYGAILSATGKKNTNSQWL
jgi:NAD(P)-dependent dehydrogenase (short-subunit alcohol dehydrogenase family)